MRGFVLAMVWRELRAGPRRLLLFALCIGLGVAGLVAVKSFGENLERAIRREARNLMAADLALRSNRPFTPEEQQALERLRARGARVTTSEEFVTMVLVPATGQVRLVEARAVGAGYPFYGDVLTRPAQPLADFWRDDGVLVEPTLLALLGVQVGAALRIGTHTFRVAGELLKEPDSTVQILRLGPRVLMSTAAGVATGLIGPGSRVRYRALVKLPAGLDPRVVAMELEAELPQRLASIDAYDEAQPRVQRFLGQLTRYLNLVGLVALLLGGVSVIGAVRVFISQKLDALAVLKCLGATSNQILAVYLVQTLLLGLAGSVAGALLGLALQGFLPVLLQEFLPTGFRFAIPWRAMAEGIVLGTLTTVWFALPPLLEVRRVPPARVFRRMVEPEARRGARLWTLVLNGGPALVLVALLALWQAANLRVAGIFLAVLTGTVIVLALATWLLLALIKRLPKPRAFVWRQGLTSLYRPGNHATGVTVALGVGVLLVLSVILIQQNLVSQVSAGGGPEQPNLFFIDIQSAQREPFRQSVAAAGLPAPELIPVVRARVRALNGERFRLDAAGNDHRRRVLGFEYALTYRARLDPGEEVLEGRFAPDPAVRGAQVSVLDWWAREIGMGLGDTVTFDVQGVAVTATITSIRKVELGGRRSGMFSFVFLPGALEEAPQMFAAAVHVDDESARLRLQREVILKLPNVTVFDAAYILRLIQGILDRITLVIQFMAGFSIAVGVVILVGAIAVTKYQRVREAVLLKTLGATRGAVARILSTEYVLLGTLAGLLGAAGAGVLSWGLVTLVLEGRWRLTLPPYLGVWAAAVVLVTVAGLASSYDILAKKPLDVLREE